MSKWKGKLARRIMAIVLSGAMVMSNMSAYAAELVPETSVESVEEVSDAKEQAGAENEENGEDVTPGGDVTPEGEGGENGGDQTPEGSSSSEGGESSSSSEGEQTPEGSSSSESEDESSSSSESEDESSSSSEGEDESSSSSEGEDESSSSSEGEDDDPISEGTYILNADNIDSAYVNNTKLTQPIQSGTDNYFTITKDVSIEKSGAKKFTIDGVETSIVNRMKFGGASAFDSKSITFKIAEGKTADIVVCAVNSGTGKPAQIQLCKKDGTAVSDTSQKLEDGQTPTITWSSIEAGEYFIAGYKPDSTITGNVNAYYVRVTETAATPPEPSDRGDWANVVAPEITEISYDMSKKDTSISVKVKGVVNKTGEGADKLTLNVYNTSEITDTTEPVETKVSATNTEADESGNHYTTLTFTPEKSDSYYFQAVLERSVETDANYAAKKSAVSEATEFKLPLTAPVITVADFKETTSDNKGTITVGWKPVSEANYYAIAMTYADDANKGTTIDSVTYVPTAEESSAESFTKDITGLVAGSTVKVTVQAFRGDPEATEIADIDKSEESAVRTIVLEETKVEEGTRVFEAKNFTIPSNITVGQRIPLTEDGYFTLVAKNSSIGLYKPANEYIFEDGYVTATTLKFGGTWDSKGNWIEVTTSGSAEIKVWWVSGSATEERSVALYDSNMANGQYGTPSVGENVYINKFEVSEGGTYRIASSDKVVGAKKDIRIAKIEVKEGVKVNKQYTFDGATVYTKDIIAGTYKDGDAVSYVNDYFTVLYSEKSKVEKKSYTGEQAWADEYTGGYRLNFGAVASTSMNSIKFTTKESEATVKVWWKAGANDRHMQILGADGTPIAVSTEESKKDVSYITKFKLTEAGTFYLGNAGGNNYIFKVNVTEGHVPDPVAWDTVAAPVIKSAAQTSDETGALTGSITVTLAAYIDELNGCEKVTVEMYSEDPNANKDAKPLATAASSKTTTSADDTVTVSFTPEASGTYYFIAKASRAEERETHDSAVFAMTDKFSLPLATPNITRATNDGAGNVEIAYSETPEAEKYIASAVQVTKNENGTYAPVEGAVPVTAESTEVTATLKGLTVGQYYAFSVHAVRGTDESKESEAFYKIVKDVPEQVWDYSAFGESTSKDSAQCGYSGDVNDGEATVWSLGGKGKIVPASTDGVSFLYTKINKDTNFVLEATAVIDEWTYSNGQEGFGLMVADTVGPHGHGTKFWNNSYMAVATKFEYYWNGSTVLPTTVGPGEDRTRYNMYLGLGSIARTGVTDEWLDESAAGATIPSKFVSEMLSLDHSAGTKGLTTGDYNIFGNAKSKKTGCIDIEPLLTEVKLRIEKNNTGYFITYIDKNGEETTQKFYEGRTIVDKDYAKQSLLQIDKENMYVGFFAARNAKVTFKDISFSTSSVDDGGEPEERPITYNAPNYTVLSASVSNTPEYEINFSANWNGTLSVMDGAGRELLNEDYFKYMASQQTTMLSGGSYVPVSMLDKFFEYDVEKDEQGNDKLDENGNKIRIPGTEMLKAEVKAIVPINNEVNSASKLAVGGNKFTVTFTPDRSWHKNNDELQMLSSYDTSVQMLNVNYRAYGEEGSNIYADPNGKATGDGTKEAPLDIYTAVKYAQAGQTIVLLEGTYSLKKPLVIERGIDGTADKPIRMIAVPGSYDRTKPFEPSKVVIDFNGVASGMTMAGDYWYFRGFDVTNSSDGSKGVQVSGSHNVLDQVNTYYNGNTGIQISRYKGADIDKSDDWPAHNTILNCTSYLNADSGHEDADGFAAKLTIGDGNVFDGCIAAYNADDGWDFFAKSESGPIGQVIIKNSVAYKNGYMLLDANGKLNAKGSEIAGKGNGNGFKMGGESIKGYHMVLNSYSFYNKAKGIDSNSCPDIQAYNCVSLNNKNYNVAFYTGVASYTEYKAANLISFRTNDAAVDADAVQDQLKPVTPSGAANLNDYEGASNFYWNSGKGVAANKDGKEVTADWFKSLEYKGITTVSRNADGTVNMGDFLAFSDKADSSAFVKLEETTNEKGIKSYKVVEGTADLPSIGGQPSDDKNAAVDEDKNTSGNITSGDDEDISSSDIWTDEEFEQLDVNGNTLKILLDIDHNSKGYYTDYTGIALKPAVRVAYGLNELIKKNYSVSYKNTKNAYELRPGDEGFDKKLAPTVVIKGKGNYAGEYNLYFVINRINLSSDKVTSADITTVATGRAQKINPAVTFNGKKLGAKDYTISKVYTKEPVKAEDGTETGEFKETAYTGSYETAGTYYIELNAVEGGNFEGTKTVKVTVLSAEEAANKTPMSKAKVDKIPDQIYDGTAHRPAVTVKDLTPSTFDGEGNYVAGDYDVAYYNNTDIGIASVVLTGNLEKGYYGTKTVTFKTLAKPFNVKDYAVTVKGTFDGKTYTATTDEEYKNLVIPSSGSAVTFGNIVVKVIANEGSEDVRLREGIDYTVSYKGNNKAGSASVVIKGMGDFKGSMTRSFKITPFMIDSSNTTVEPIGAQVYAKGGVKPSVIVKVNGKVVSAKNYSVSYKNNTKVGTATVSITGKNLLKGSLKEIGSFDITAKNLRSTNIIAENVYYGTAKTNTEPGNQIAYATKLSVKDGNKKLSLNSDYVVTYYEEDGTPVFNYSTGELKFRKTVIVKNEDGTETTKEEVVPATPLEKNSKIAYNGSNKTIYAVITGGKSGLYTGASFASYRVVGKNDIKSAKITKIKDVYTYNDGNMAAPKLEVKIQNRHLEDGKYVKDAEFTTLKLNEDYEIVNLKNNDRAGTCTITIKGIGYYAGTNKASFKIEKKDLTAWNAYLAHAVVTDITVNVDEADVVKGGKYEGAFTFDDIETITKDEEGKDVVTTETSPLKKAAAGKIYTVGTKESITLEYGKDYSATTYSDNKVDVSKLVFDENGYAYQTATVTIKGEGYFTGSRTIRFTIKVKKTATA